MRGIAMARLTCLIIGYIFGLFQTGYFYGKRRGVDIRTKGSGNAGTTNTLRVFGLRAGLITLLFDAGKCILAILLTTWIFQTREAELFPLLKIWTAAGVILGHNYPFFLHFKGGKGIAATTGMMIAFGDPCLVVLCIGSFLLVFILTHYVSLSSLFLSSLFFIGMVIRGQKGLYGMLPAYQREMYMLTAALTLMAFWRHRTNIGRLLRGKEHKTRLFSSHHGKDADKEN